MVRAVASGATWFYSAEPPGIYGRRFSGPQWPRRGLLPDNTTDSKCCRRLVSLGLTTRSVSWWSILIKDVFQCLQTPLYRHGRARILAAICHEQWNIICQLGHMTEMQHPDRFVMCCCLHLHDTAHVLLMIMLFVYFLTCQLSITNGAHMFKN